MHIFKSALFFILYYILFILMIVGLYLFINKGYNEGISLHWILTLISVFLISIPFLKSIKTGGRPKKAIGLGFIWLLLTGIFDYVFLVDHFSFLSDILPNFDGMLGDAFSIFDSMKFELFYQKGLITLIIRGAIILLCPFIFSLFIPQSSNNVPSKK